MKKNTNTDKNLSVRNKKNRRALLKSLAVGGGAVAAVKEVPGDWIKPAINSTLLPAHAATTCAISSFSVNVDAGGDDQGTFNSSATTDDVPTATNDIEFNITANVNMNVGGPYNYNLFANETQSANADLNSVNQNVQPSINGVLSFSTISTNSHGDNDGDTGVQFTLTPDNPGCGSPQAITIVVPVFVPPS